MACGGCEERRRNVRRIIEAAKKRDTDTITREGRNFLASSGRDINQKIITPARNFYKLPTWK